MYGSSLYLAWQRFRHPMPRPRKQDNECQPQWAVRLEGKIDAVFSALKHLITQGNKIMGDLTDITAAVAEETTVDQSILTLMTSMADQINSLKNDPVALAALATQIRANSAALSAAIVANTPVAAPPVDTGTAPTT